MNEFVSKTILYRLIDNFTKRPVMTVSLPYIPERATNGYYSRMFKRLKRSGDFGFQRSRLRGKFWFDGKKSSSALIDFHNGCSIDLPIDTNAQDFAIIDLHLKALSMAITPRK